MTDSPRTQRVRNTLEAAVQIATGIPDAKPRPGQLALADDMTKAADPLGGHIAGIAPTGVGKALDLDTPIPTPTGWTRMGELNVGDELFDENGQVIRVTEAHPVRHDRDCYELGFSDGSTIVADAEHLWFTTTRAERARISDLKRSLTRYPNAAEANRERLATFSAGAVRTTMELRGTLTGQGDAKNHAIPVALPLVLPDANLIIDPYVLGAWLGDGSSNNSQITSADPFIPEEIERRGYFLTKLSAPLLYGIKLTANSTAATRPTLTGYLRNIGVLNNKHIPTAYLRASASQRLDLLRGLMDTDGTVSQNGQSEICVVNEGLARGIFELVTSLGIKATFNSGTASITEDDPENPGKKRSRGVGTRYRVHFTTDMVVTLLPRKRELLPTATRMTQLVRYITSITPVESRPVRCITVSGGSHLFLAGEAMIPTHNSLTGLSEAAVGAACYDERWIISTESIGLQAQYADKDGPVISAATERLFGKPVRVEVLKGWSNYTCVMKARETAQQMGVDIPAGEGKIVNVAQRVAKAKLPREVTVDGYRMPSAALQPLVAWSLAQHGDENLPGDRGSYQGTATDSEWQAVSVSPAECLGEAMCPLAVICKPIKSRERVAAADIVITNHSMLAVQAATGAPVVIGSAKLGPFHGIIVDEAHALPAIVRNQGQSEISGRRVLSVLRKVKGVLSDRDPHVAKWLADGQHVAEHVESRIAQNIPRGTADPVKIAEDADPLDGIGDMLIDFLRRGSKFVQQGTGKSADMSVMIRGKRVVSEIDNVVAAINSVRDHYVGTARWLQPPRQQTPDERAKGLREWSAAQAAPVAVGKMIERNVWNEVTKATEDEEESVRPLTVACLSATLPDGFARDVGLSVPVAKHYESPFDLAYGNSMLYIPRAVDDADVQALGVFAYKRWKFNTAKHAAWAAQYMVKLVEANRGSTLVLSATKGAGVKYAQELRAQARGRWNVYSQWDGENPRVITARWRDDPSSVMVGTKSMMTGVDAPGETCSLVIVDRAPRAAGNPVDDARVEMIAEAFGGDKWAADRLVYVSDATLLLEQALGRLIRSMSDSGMAAILDPRMLKAGPYQYGDPVRKQYQKAMGRFPNKTSNLNEALEYLTARKAKRRGR